MIKSVLRFEREKNTKSTPFFVAFPEHPFTRTSQHARISGNSQRTDIAALGRFHEQIFEYWFSDSLIHPRTHTHIHPPNQQTSHKPGPRPCACQPYPEAWPNLVGAHLLRLLNEKLLAAWRLGHHKWPVMWCTQKIWSLLMPVDFGREDAREIHQHHLFLQHNAKILKVMPRNLVLTPNLGHFGVPVF